MRLPNTPRLLCFLAVAQSGSLVAAAQQVNLTHSAVSRHISTLEAQLGVALFRRSRQRLHLTEAGRQYAGQVRVALDTLTLAQWQLRSLQDNVTLTVSCEPSLAQCWLIPQLTEHAGAGIRAMSLRLVSAGGPVDVQGTTIDLAIWREDFALAPGAQRTPLMAEHMGVVCAPSMAATARQLKAPRLLTTSRAHAWEDWEHLAGLRWKACTGLVFDHFHLAIAAARVGLGAAVTPYPHVAVDLQAGRLVAPYGFVPTPTMYVALSDPGRSTAARTAQFLQWLAARAAKAVPA
ncbi:MAG: LysR family transcriptional regulator [Burkholderiales bacterium]|nr:LysR family transcriptional regulator [Burkholderiales bacterium]